MKVGLDIEELVEQRIQESIAAKQALLDRDGFLCVVAEVARTMVESLRNGGTVFFFGNGGSAADAQHLAAELAGRFRLERPAVRALALTTNTSCLTAISNDYGYDLVFARQLEAFGNEGDVAIGISTSGSSQNVVVAIEAAKRRRMSTVAMTGYDGGSLRAIADYSLCVSSHETPRIQEAHILLGHVLCEIIENELFGAEGAC